MGSKPQKTISKTGQPLLAVVADASGNVFELPNHAAVGMDGDTYRALASSDTRPMPHGSELMRLPNRRPRVMNLESGQIETLQENPYAPGEPIYPVAAFNSPGFVVTQVCAYEQTPRAQMLPLFAYGAVGWQGSSFRTAVIRIDREPRQDLRQMPSKKVQAGLKWMRRQLPGNRLRRHLEKCALSYGCPAAKNFFLGRYEAPLPTSRSCNALCRGCLSKQTGADILASQDRIGFTPSAKEIADVALMHLGRVQRPVVSFGQGCEGDPLMAAETIAAAIVAIRQKTSAGTINMNTNASRPDLLRPVLDAGLDAIRVSLNSVQPRCYHAYFRPRDYRFEDVAASIDMALTRGCFVAINYLNMPGFTDGARELYALETFLGKHRVHMIQWRNMNYDPHAYWRTMGQVADTGSLLGMRAAIDRIRRSAPHLMHGYFNPPRENWPSRVAADGVLTIDD